MSGQNGVQNTKNQGDKLEVGTKCFVAYNNWQQKMRIGLREEGQEAYEVQRVGTMMVNR